jgi:hypothetical protein
MRYFAREHISHIVNRVGQPASSLWLTNEVGKRGFLKSLSSNMLVVATAK